MRRLYAGIGSRKTPPTILKNMTKTAKWLRKRGFILRSGGALGADSAFAAGAGMDAEIFFPTCRALTDKCLVGQTCFCTIPEDAFSIASEFHPAWDKLNDYVKRLHARNVQILFGKDLDDKVDFVVLWSAYDKQRGGTALGWKIAEAYNIPVVSLKDTNAAEQIMELAGVAPT